MPTKTGAYNDKGKDPIRQGDKGDKLNDKYQLNIDTLDRDAKQNGSAKLPKSAR
jgi:hypothetical protein